MIKKWLNNPRLTTTAAFTLFSSYLLSFTFEGQLLYDIAEAAQVESILGKLVLPSTALHLVGLLLYGFVLSGYVGVRKLMIGVNLICAAAILIFYFCPPGWLWYISLWTSSLAAGCAVAAWSYDLKAFSSRSERVRTCADMFIFSNVLMTLFNLVGDNFSPRWGVLCALLAVAGAIALNLIAPESKDSPTSRESYLGDKSTISLKPTMWLLVIFVFLLTINSGLMYQVFVPAFEHLSTLASWYWALPYVAAMLVLRNISQVWRAHSLYAAMIMIVGAFVLFILMERNTIGYLAVDTLMLFACGVFDLFWWSVLGEMLEYTKHPARIFGIGLAANVAGVFAGGLLGHRITTMDTTPERTAVIALAVVCVTLILLAPLNEFLRRLLRSHAYLYVFGRQDNRRERSLTPPLFAPLSKREEEVRQLILEAKSNKAMAELLNISENTVKTHLKSIYGKYDVATRAELISVLLKDRL